MSLMKRLEKVIETRAPVEETTQKPASPVPSSNPPAASVVERDASVMELSTEPEVRHYQLKHLIMDEVMGQFSSEVIHAGVDENQLRVRLEEVVQQVLGRTGISASREERTMLVNDLMDELVGFGPITPLLDDRTVTRITVNGPKEVDVERMGKLERTHKQFRDDVHVIRLIEKIAKILGSRIDRKVPMIDATLPDNGKFRARIPPLASEPRLDIVKGPENPFEVLSRQKRQREREQVAPTSRLMDAIRERIVAELDSDFYLPQQRERLTELIDRFIDMEVAEQNIVLSRAERSQLQIELLNEITGYGPIEPLLHDPEITEIMVNGANQVYVERRGKLQLTQVKFRDDKHVMQVIEKIVAPLGRRIDEKSPYVDARLPDGSRVNAIIPPIAIDGPSLTIRKFRREGFTMQDLINMGTLTLEAAQFLQAAVQARLNIVISGGTGSGKTTTLNVLSSFISFDERIVTIEDSAELQLKQEHVVRLEARPPNIEGEGEVTIRDLVRNALRMRPDRIIVGECRSGEALDMLQAMNTGHDGSMTTIHANNPREMLSRLETMVLMAGMELPVRAIREQIAGAIDLIVHEERMRDGVRRITHITEVVGMEGDVITMQDLYLFEQEGLDEHGRVRGQLKATGLRPRCYDKIVRAGIRLPLTVFSHR